ncbi:MAG: Holliday junction resolvase RuvX [Epulopiscium sp.]|nr:Holliday junction resolvase RuvX [Candidatus Epulonipiscium sp.]
MRILGLDFGEKTLGVAISDPFGWTAQGLETIHRKEEEEMKATWARLEEIIKEYQVQEIVLGLPKNMNNTLGPRAEKTIEFQTKLQKKFSLPIHTWDERLSTVAATRSLLEADMSRKKRKQVIDKMAATYILQGYLDHLSNNILK